MLKIFKQIVGTKDPDGNPADKGAGFLEKINGNYAILEQLLDSINELVKKYITKDDVISEITNGTPSNKIPDTEAVVKFVNEQVDPLEDEVRNLQIESENIIDNQTRHVEPFAIDSSSYRNGMYHVIYTYDAAMDTMGTEENPLPGSGFFVTDKYLIMLDTMVSDG